MRVTMAGPVRVGSEEMARLLAEAFDGVDDTGVEVRIERASRPAESFTGRAYSAPPKRPRPHGDTRFLVRLLLPGTLRNRGYPKSYRYARRSTAPWITVADWRERLLALAAHEAFHVHQFREGLRRSEVQAERWAADVLTRWRASRQRSPVVTSTGQGDRWDQLRIPFDIP